MVHVTDMPMKLVQAVSQEQIEAARDLIIEYAKWLEFDLAYQGFEQELSDLPGKYAPPKGALLLAFVNEQPAGVIAMRPLDGSTCEMKRLYVRPHARGLGVGRILIEKILSAARLSGYATMRLDTVAGKMESAIDLYRKFGFREIEPYYNSPVEHTTYFEKQL